MGHLVVRSSSVLATVVAVVALPRRAVLVPSFQYHRLHSPLLVQKNLFFLPFSLRCWLQPSQQLRESPPTRPSIRIGILALQVCTQRRPASSCWCSSCTWCSQFLTLVDLQKRVHERAADAAHAVIVVAPCTILPLFDVC